MIDRVTVNWGGRSVNLFIFPQENLGMGLLSPAKSNSDDEKGDFGVDHTVRYVDIRSLHSI